MRISIADVHRRGQDHRAAVHPKIAQTLELGKVGNELFIAMEYVEGVDVLPCCASAPSGAERTPSTVAVFIAHEVLDALDFAHTRDR